MTGQAGRKAGSARATSAAAPSGPTSATGTAVRVDSQRASIGTHEKKPLVCATRGAHLQQRGNAGFQRDPNMDVLSGLARLSVITIATVRSVCPISSCRWVSPVNRPIGSCAAVKAIHSIEPFRSRAARKMRSESDVITYRDIKFGTDIRVPDCGNPNMRHGGLADAWIRRQQDNALLVYRRYSRVEREAIKENLPVSGPHGYPSLPLACPTRTHPPPP